MTQHRSIAPNLSLVAVALAQAFASPAAFAQQANANADAATVVVTGIRASAQSSVAIKRNTMEVVDSITAEDIGKLPDPNVAETLTRLPGVQGYRYGGEGASPAGYGSGLTIRGLAGQTASQVNDRAYFTAGAREFNIEDAIPGMIAGVDVYKNPSAEHIEGGIGGLVNVRTRNPSDFKKFTAAVNTSMRYNDLAKKTDPEVFGLLANRIDLGGGSRIGWMAAFAFQKSTGRSDSNPANRGPDFRRVVRADTAEYANLAAANTANGTGQPMAKYVGRNDVSYLAPVTMRSGPGVGVNMPDTSGLTPDQAANIIATPAVNTSVFQETIMRQRKGLNLAADYRVDNTLRFYLEGNYTGYLYHQNYRFIFVDNGGNVQNLRTTPYTVTEDMVNRNFNGGSNDVVTTQRLVSGTYLNTSLRPWGGDEHSPYSTWIGAGGAEWSPTPSWKFKADFSYIKSDRKQDNRRVEMAGLVGEYWDVTRVADGSPHQLTFSGPSLNDPHNFVFERYTSGNFQTWDDKGHALALDGAYTFDSGLLDKLKFGTRYAHQQSLYKNNAWGARPLTTDGKSLAADRSNAILVSSMPGVLQYAPTNFMGGDAGYAGGYVVYNPDALLGNKVMGQFPNANIPAENAFPENDLLRRFLEENTLAGYLVGDFSALGDRIKGNVGVRVVRTESKATGRVTDQSQAVQRTVDNHHDTSYTNVLPTFNATYSFTDGFLARFGYGRGMTRPDLGALNPAVTVDAQGAYSMGNPDLRPQVANSVDLSFERYFSPTNYAAVAFFNKDIKGFFNKVERCMSVPFLPAYTGTRGICSNGQYLIGQQVNAEKGFARGVELSGQWFFNDRDSWLKNFGVSGTYTYVNTSNPVNVGTTTAPVFITTQQPFASKNSYSVSGLYEDQKVSARLVYTWRSTQLWGGVNALNPMGSGYIAAYGLLDASFNYAFDDHLTLSLNGSNLTNKAPNRYVGEAQTYETGQEFQHFDNGRTFSVGLRYKF